MHRAALVLTTIASLFAPSAMSAQADVPRAYMLDMKVEPAGVQAWVEYQQNHGARIHGALVEDGALLASDLWVRHTGGEYNLRYNYVLPDFGAVAEAGGRAAQHMDADAAAAAGGLTMSSESTDAIWYIGASSFPDGWPTAPYAYESALEIDMGQLAQWKADFVRLVKPRLDRAVEQGVIVAWARLDHSIGGPWNTKVVLWMPSWEAMESVGDLLGPTVEDPDSATAAGSAILNRVDMIWRPVPQPGT